MKGWVYVITNQSMPNLVKVGYSTKDPGLRAKELYSTGVPHYYVVEYDALLNEPYEIEQKVHKLLKGCIENKEWFRCDVIKAVATIRQVAGGTIMHESIKYPFDADEQFNLGLVYENGNGVEQDLKQAVYWYTKAAEQGYADAQYNLALIYENGNGVEQDFKQAVYWYTKAAEQGYGDAQYNLALTYENGNGVEQDVKQAVYWYTKAAEQGYSKAQFNLGLAYSKGYGVVKNKNKAKEWFIKYAEQGLESVYEKIIGKFVVEDGIATDTETGLMWLRFAYGQQWEVNNVIGDAKRMGWKDAIALPVKFNQKGYAGYNDWRLPNNDELKTLIDRNKGRKGNYIDADVFPKSPMFSWSSSLYAYGDNGAWSVSFSDGSFNDVNKSYNIFVRLVR
jgi:hypothetical protein